MRSCWSSSDSFKLTWLLWSWSIILDRAGWCVFGPREEGLGGASGQIAARDDAREKSRLEFSSPAFHARDLRGNSRVCDAAHNTGKTCCFCKCPGIPRSRGKFSGSVGDWPFSQQICLPENPGICPEIPGFATQLRTPVKRYVFASSREFPGLAGNFPGIPGNSRRDFSGSRACVGKLMGNGPSDLW